MRYNKTNIRKNLQGSRYQESTAIPKIPFTDSDRYIQVSVSDRLDLISHQFYGTRDFWWVIAAANNIGKGTMNIQEGAILRLPDNPSSFINKNTGV